MPALFAQQRQIISERDKEINVARSTGQQRIGEKPPPINIIPVAKQANNITENNQRLSASNRSEKASWRKWRRE